MFEFSVHSLPLLMESVTGPRWLNRLPKADRKFAKSLQNWIRLLYLAYPPLQPLMLRVLGRWLASEGRTRKAAAKFERAEAIARQREMPYQRARALLDLVAVKEDGREKNRAKAIELLRETQSVIPRAESWLLEGQNYNAVIAASFHPDVLDLEDPESLVAR